VREYEGLVADALRRYLKEDEQGIIGFFRREGRIIRVEDVVLEASEHERMQTVSLGRWVDKGQNSAC
jgi:hypothetical protein